MYDIGSIMIEATLCRKNMSVLYAPRWNRRERTFEWQLILQHPAKMDETNVSRI